MLSQVKSVAFEIAAYTFVGAITGASYGAVTALKACPQGIMEAVHFQDFVVPGYLGARLDTCHSAMQLSGALNGALVGGTIGLVAAISRRFF